MLWFPFTEFLPTLLTQSLQSQVLSESKIQRFLSLFLLQSLSLGCLLVRTSAYFPDTLGYLIFPLKASFLPYHCLLPGAGLQASNLIVKAPFLLSPTPLLQEAAEIYSMPALGLEVFQTLIKLSLSFQNKQLNKKKRMVVT